MGLLVSIAAGCCAVLVGVAAALWWSIRHEHAMSGEPVPRLFVEAMQQSRKTPHPRMDLAAGIAAGAAATRQHVRGAARRRGLSLDAAAEADAAKNGSGIAAKIPGRTDWAYYNGQPGDLSDPDLRRAPAGGVRRPLGTVSLPEPR